MMTDQEKIDWFDETMKWIDQWGSAAEAIEAAENSPETSFDLFFDVIDQYEKWKSSP